MLAYLVVFIPVIGLTAIAERYKKYKSIFIFLVAVCILILSLFAALRGLTVGTDVMVYGKSFFDNAGRYNSLLSYYQAYGKEPLYFLLNYVVYNLCGNVHVLFFVSHVIISSLVYYIAFNDSEDNTAWMFVCAYLFFWYSSSLNIMRQSFAMFVVLYAYRYIEKKQYVKYLISVLIAFMFHTTAVLALAIPFGIFISNRKHKYLYTGISVAAVLMIYMFFDQFIQIVSRVPILALYFDEYYYFFNKETNFIWYYAVMKLIILVGVYLFYICEKRCQSKSNNLLLLLFTFDFLLYCSSSVIGYGYRFSYYMLPFSFLLISRMDSKMRPRQGLIFPSKLTFRIFIIVSCFVYWYVRYAIVKYDGILPYVFYWS